MNIHNLYKEAVGRRLAKVFEDHQIDLFKRNMSNDIKTAIERRTKMPRFEVLEMGIREDLNLAFKKLRELDKENRKLQEKLDHIQHVDEEREHELFEEWASENTEFTLARTRYDGELGVYMVRTVQERWEAWIASARSR